LSEEISPEAVPEEVKKRGFPKKAVVAVVIIVIVIVASLTVWWYKFRVVPAGTYSKYGISFDYPEGANIIEQGVLKDTPDAYSGVVSCGWTEGAIEYTFAVSWVKTLYFDIEAGFEGGFSAMEEKGASNLIRGERGNSTFKGQTLHYQLSEFDIDKKHFYGAMACIYFIELEKEFVFVYICEYENPLPRLFNLLETFEAE